MKKSIIIALFVMLCFCSCASIKKNYYKFDDNYKNVDILWDAINLSLLYDIDSDAILTAPVVNRRYITYQNQQTFLIFTSGNTADIFLSTYDKGSPVLMVNERYSMEPQFTSDMKFNAFIKSITNWYNVIESKKDMKGAVSTDKNSEIVEDNSIKNISSKGNIENLYALLKIDKMNPTLWRLFDYLQTHKNDPALWEDYGDQASKLNFTQEALFAYQQAIVLGGQPTNIKLKEKYEKIRKQ